MGHKIKKRRINRTLLSLFFFFIALPVLPARAETVTPFRVTRVHGHVGLGLEREDDSRERKRDGDEIKSDDRSFLEELGLGFDGFIYHPRLIDFRTDSKLIYKQQSNESNLQFQEDVDDQFFDYSLAMAILKEHGISLQLTATQATQETNSSFFESRQLTANRKEAVLRYRHKSFPTLLGYEITESKGEGLDLTDDRLNTVFLDIENESELGRSTFRYENEEKRQAVGNLDLNTNLYYLTNYNPFGRDDRHTMSSTVRFREQTGNTEIRDATVGEALSFRHTDTLESYYYYTYEDTKLQEQVTTSYQHRAGIKHELFKSLTSGLELRGRKFRLNSGTEDSLSGEASLNYRKRLPFGKVALNYRTLLQNEDENFSGDKISILREAHTFGETGEGDDVILLNRDLIDAVTIEFEEPDEKDKGILITDPLTGLPIEEGIHYRVETLNTLTKIRLLSPDGDFLRGDPVAVNYSFEPSPPIEFRTTTHTYGARLRLKDTWTFFYDGGRINQDLKSGTDLERLDDTKRRGFGAELVYKNSTTFAEKQVFRSRRNPYERTRFSETLLFRFEKIRFSPLLSLGAGYTESRTLEGVEKTIGRQLSARLFLKLPRGMHWDLEAKYQNQDMIGEDQETLEFHTNYRWNFRKVDLVLTYDFLKRKREIEGDEDKGRLFFRVRRHFSVRR